MKGSGTHFLYGRSTLFYSVIRLHNYTVLIRLFVSHRSRFFDSDTPTDPSSTFRRTLIFKPKLTLLIKVIDTLNNPLTHSTSVPHWTSFTPRRLGHFLPLPPTPCVPAPVSVDVVLAPLYSGSPKRLRERETRSTVFETLLPRLLSRLPVVPDPPHKFLQRF